MFSEFGLNLTKTETMVFNWQASIHGQYPESIIQLNGHNIDNSTDFKYLGVWISYNNLHIGNKELCYRINSAHSAFAEHRKLLTNLNIRLNTRIMFFNTLVRTRLTYGCHAWKPFQAEIQKINSTHRYLLRNMIWNGHSRINPPPRNTDTPLWPSGDGPSDAESDDPSDAEYDWRYLINNENLYRITRTEPLEIFL